MQNKHKKKDPETAPPDANDAKSQQNLQLNPIGQDAQRKRYWVVDGPCAFISHSSPCFLFACIWCEAAFFWPHCYPALAVCKDPRLTLR